MSSMCSWLKGRGLERGWEKGKVMVRGWERGRGWGKEKEKGWGRGSWCRRSPEWRATIPRHCRTRNIITSTTASN